MEEKCEWLREAWNSQTAQMQCLEEEVARLGRGSSELRKRVAEVEGVNASQLDRIAGLKRELEDLRSGVAGAEPVRTLASAAGAGERPVIVAQSVSEASTGE